MVGGIYGVAVGWLFCAESMFSVQTGGSKIALLALAKALHTWSMPMLDAQLPNAHLTSLGAIEIRRHEFLERARNLSTNAPTPNAWLDFSIIHADQLFSGA